jgi:hypothetical protein
MIRSIEDLVRDAIPNLLKCLIYIDNSDNYILFEQYSIKKHNDYVLLKQFRDDKELKFSKIRNATAYAVLDRHNKLFEANKVFELDLKLSSIAIDKLLHDKLKRSKDIEEHIIYTTKLQTDYVREKQFQHELDKYIIMANECQQRGFENELKRTTRNQKD